MAEPRTGNIERQDSESEHIGPLHTGDNISAKRVANYIWNGSAWERQSSSQGSVAADFQFNDSDATTTPSTEYFGYTKPDGTWLVKKLTATTLRYATIANNDSVTTYEDAWDAIATLTYGRYDEAF